MAETTGAETPNTEMNATPTPTPAPTPAPEAAPAAAPVAPAAAAPAAPAAGGMWATMSAENKKRVYVSAAVLLIVIFAIFRIASHRTTPAGGPQAGPTSQIPTDIPTLERIAAAEPTPEHYVNLSASYCNARRFRECVGAAEAALKLRPNYVIALNNVAAGLEGMGEWDAAIGAAQATLQVKPDMKLSQQILAHCLQEQQKLADKTAKFEELVKTDPTTENYLNLSDCYFKTHRYPEVIAVCKKAVAMKPDFAEGYNNMAAAYQMQKDWDNAIKYAQKAIDIKPGFQTAARILEISTARKKQGMAQ